MADPVTIPLPLAPNSADVAASEPTAPEWQGYTPAEPLEAQGDYNPLHPEMPLELPEVAADSARAAAPGELLAPAGGIEAAYAAFHFGADAIFLGMKKFSARAEAENFSLEDIDTITAYAHALTPRRRVFVTINTLIRQDELPELIEAVAGLAEIGVDALIIQDMGVYRLVRNYFPNLELHASTQLAVHNRAGAETLKQLGFPRVVLARELTFEEVRDITATAGVETEVFIHGALCYSYSGLCLFSSQTTGRSGNRGKCNYSCRDTFTVDNAPMELRDGTPVRRDPSQGFPFSMKDLALPDHLPALRAAGVSCFKIEGRKKSPLYVATTTDYYRRLIDGTLDTAERPNIEADLQTVFSRPWTRLFMQSHRDKEVADRDTVGHRGTKIGTVERVGKDTVRFRSDRPLQKHDGIQIDLPSQGRPFGFAVEKLVVIERSRDRRSGDTRREVLESPAGALVEVTLPEHPPVIPTGATVYCSSSQDVKQKYRYNKPKPDQFRVRVPIHLTATLTADGLTVTATLAEPQADWQRSIAVTQTLAGPFVAASDLNAMAEAVDRTFDKLGQTRFERRNWQFDNPAQAFVPVSKLNALRRDLCAALDAELTAGWKHRTQQVLAETTVPAAIQKAAAPQPTDARWSLHVDRITMLDELTADDWSDLDEISIDIARDHPATLASKLELWAERVGRDRIRLALPAVTRAWEEKAIRAKIEKFRAAGWNRWMAGNWSAWSYLGLNPTERVPATMDLAADWSVYVINRLAAQQLRDLGVSRFTLSPEDGLKNIRTLVSEFREAATLIVHQDTPMFMAESCAYANLIGGCPGKANCRFESMEMTSSHGEQVTALDYHCRTIVLNRGAFCLASRLASMKLGAIRVRADFIFRKYDAIEVRDRLRLLRSGQDVPYGHAANFERGLL
ncbi:peptidase U32 family protein [Tuwongella immobilis]|uniref:Peptidase U32 collagenase domain-containing protein n=1 Tax=Tuwongella immobilis TaxID=692036 RepID=A0A6C2YVJ2_9BACT|nr:U32 family peptidase [Tuwongella immobilis]VIP05640.1 peptidase u32 : Peptidase U32 OS=Proteobacteria bacterium CAG:495 GN=BN682_01579 PE=4 SV=1: Peptidase_U32: DUF3656 [Tuwongella immobilis]VTS08636.1 peptidase u32 : Peptidase U32 OS=Proteobacteria bacterium CAG:495 GN=BN682_01579 PE=4 SV=1: Peptidase_U32: DUF3656 [Tuwongella immobilis]